MGKIGIIREVDKLGRIVIPKELRIFYKVENEAEIIATEEGILLRNPQYVLVKKGTVDNTDI